MAGSYPDVPGNRMAYDADGTIGTYQDADLSSAITEFTTLELVNLNSEDEGFVSFGVNEPTRFVGLIFPELREIDGIFWAYSDRGTPSTVETSVDTTNTRDGNWVQQIADLDDYTVVAENYRNNITSMAVSNVRGIRLRAAASGSANSQRFKAWHQYGEISPGQTPDRLIFIDESTGLAFTAAVDYGNVPRGSSEDLEWRIKNNSATLTATTIQYTVEDLYLDSADWYTHTLPGGDTYQATRQVASIGPDTTSGLIKTRRITAGGEALGLNAARLFLAVVGSWS